MHISYLPWNRGAHPNFWSFYDATPSGVSIHLIDEGVDTGDILYQRHVVFQESENTFSKTYKRLKSEIEALFNEHIDEIIEARYQAEPQQHRGTYHSIQDLPKRFRGWDSNIKEEILRLTTSTNED